MAVVSNVHKPIQRVKQNEETKEYIRSQGTQGEKKYLMKRDVTYWVLEKQK